MGPKWTRRRSSFQSFIIERRTLCSWAGSPRTRPFVCCKTPAVRSGESSAALRSSHRPAYEGVGWEGEMCVPFLTFDTRHNTRESIKLLRPGLYVDQLQCGGRRTMWTPAYDGDPSCSSCGSFWGSWERPVRNDRYSCVSCAPPSPSSTHQPLTPAHPSP